MERQTLTVTEAANRLGISRGHAYRLVKAGKLGVLRIGWRPVFRVPVRIVERILEGSETLEVKS